MTSWDVSILNLSVAATNLAVALWTLLRACQTWKEVREMKKVKKVPSE
jgi:hypothetical protein